MAKGKTNAMRILEAKGIDYKMSFYDDQDGKVDGISVAKKIGREPKEVYKTLVTEGTSRQIYVFVIPVEAELDLKKAAKVIGEKKVEMIPVKDILKWTGYIRGGCSPIGMKKLYPTFIDKSAASLKTLIVSGGKIGVQIELTVGDLVSITEGKMEDIAK
ncbi:Cys-tRNA(Pro) deacylase [Bacillus aquiflavi]|uniref:Cys-tRNA(Pro)/Cys-tRNA(Cys) deacylase n=1 Tax=Bacillus aquiflavi TaxID=2672567 RepID=A0A6B3VXN4_9BACI|nr:Cys-tRNA(Pro) deacylase [Bacillus aquiflavi]MBA4535728.1 Cys-tRNA(Pro) deacylase [Bacillus aquiflavi]NEY80104.1 Cys-tRNA(Pro) deacylase [Bacillus aquiflavi]UAC48002.1 Cys-tRNA(Pro) deacylase [Bacillus aquiflavi]